ncbi:MAG: PBP1A family penicillin-binding protein [Rhizobiales bacterium]|nr:PBP1A family penicillin-binding protein [Hyphomicrobiales bacterium]
MSDWFFKRGGGSRFISPLAVDAWLDSSLYRLWCMLLDKWAAAAAFAGRFRVTGLRRVACEVLSEGFTLGTAGAAAMLLLAIPSFQAVDREDWLARGEYSVTLLDVNGKEIGKRGVLHSDAVPLEEIPDYLIKATLATEDRRFYQHIGIDFLGTARALIENLRANAVVQGGSTLTQQLAKNLFLTSERSIERKIKEAFLAFWLETHLTKQEILKLYLDRAYLGGGAFGVEAASQFYFNKSVRDLTVAEAALLAGLYKAPTSYAPHINLAASRQRTTEVLDNLVEAGFMTEGQVHAARINPAEIVQIENPNSPDWFLDWAFEEVRRLLDGRNTYVVTARTTIDLRLQQVADNAVAHVMRTDGKVQKRSQTALVAMETDGAVRALVGGRDYGESQFNRATSARRQPGSSFKPYVYLTAVEHGYRPNTIVSDTPFSCGRGHVVKNYSGGYGGRLTLASALARSTNTVAVKLSHEVGRETVIDNMERMGIRRVRPSCTMALGDDGITVLEQTGAYAVFANGGMSAKPYGILDITSSSGEVVYRRDRDAEPRVRLFEERVVADLNYMLGEVVTAGTGKRAFLDFTTSGGKTGTSSSYRDAWFLGFTGKYAAGVWFGNDDFTPTARATGGSVPASIWREFMVGAHDSPNIPAIPGLPLHPNQIAELQRLAALAKSQPTAATEEERNRIMPVATRDLLAAIAEKLREASEQAEALGERAALDGNGIARGAAQ